MKRIALLIVSAVALCVTTYGTDVNTTISWPQTGETLDQKLNRLIAVGYGIFTNPTTATITGGVNADGQQTTNILAAVTNRINTLQLLITNLASDVALFRVGQTNGAAISDITAWGNLTNDVATMKADIALIRAAQTNGTASISVNNPTLYDQNVTNMQACTFTLTITNAASGSYAWGGAGVSNVVNIPARLTNVGVQLFAVAYNRHTNTAFNADWIITTNPIYWNTLGSQAYVTNTDRAYQVGKIKIDTDTNDITGFTKSVLTNQVMTLPPGQLYFYMKYRSTSVNAGETPYDTMTLHFFNN